jgi:fatty acid elongase 3
MAVAIIDFLDEKLSWFGENGPEFMNAPPPNETIAHPLIGMIVYLAGIFLLRHWMRDRKAMNEVLRWPLALHNYFLCLLSLFMVIGISVRVAKIYLTEGFYHVYCGTADPFSDQRLLWWGFVFYLSKYYELIDTVFLVLRKRDLSFLHVYHHAIVLMVCWLAMNQQIVMGWFTCFNNASVHVLMYYYYAEQARGSGPIWWRRYLTSMQMVQFVLDCTTSLPYIYFWKTGIYCRGSMLAWGFANFVGITFFFLFLNFYLENYVKNKGDKGRKGGSAASNDLSKEKKEVKQE